MILLFFLLDFNQPAGLETEKPKKPIVQNPIDFEALEAEKARIERLIHKHSLGVNQLVDKVTNALFQDAGNAVLIAQKARTSEEIEPIPEQIIKDMPASGELIGLSVSGQRILILFDVSASMSEETLIKIITGMSDPSGARLSAGPKWIQAKRIVAWTLENAPSSSNVQILAYSDQVTRITPAWISPKEALVQFSKGVIDLSPYGGTSLGRVLEFVQKHAIKATDIYVITDGLPTLSGDERSGVSAIKNCFRLPSKQPAYVEGVCREALFDAAVTLFQKESNANVNIILLPLEGDPKAAPYYWKWASANRGVLFSPARGWP